MKGYRAAMDQPETESASATGKIRRLVLVLALMSVIGVTGRVLVFDNLQLSGGHSLWRLLIDATIDAEEDTVLQLSPPKNSPELRLMQQSMWHPEFDISYSKRDRESGRSILAFARNEGRSVVSFEFTVMMRPVSRKAGAPKKHPLSATARKQYLANRKELRLDSPQIRNTAKLLAGHAADADHKALAIFSYLRQLPASPGRDTMNAATVLEKQKATPLDRALTLVALCRATGIPARLVTGIEVQDESAVRILHWAQIHNGTDWRSFDFNSGSTGSVPADYLAMGFDDSRFIRVSGGQLLKLDMGIERDLDHPLLKRQDIQHYLNIFDLTRLAGEKRTDLALLLLLPFGALVTALCRHLVGLHSYGVFTPTLLALALVYTDIVSTLGILLVICALAVGGRSIFPESISRIPRLAIIFTLVAIIISLLVSTLDYFGLQQKGRVVLLPTIILTSLIDRLYRTMEDKGMGIAMRRLAWTIFVTLLCLPVIQFKQLGNLMLHYPEAHLATLAMFLLISTYKGKQLIHLPVIRFLSEPESSNKRHDKTTRENAND